MEEIRIHPIGAVVSTVEDIDRMPPGGVPAIIDVYDPYGDALHRLDENSHIWILSWFHQAYRRQLKTSPRVNRDLPEYGVFALRAASRPNPVAMSLARLIKREGNLLYVERLDAVHGTPVIDIKPYFENDIVFSPRTSYIPGKDRTYRHNHMLRQALAHHQEECRDLHLAVRMAMVADEVYGHLNRPDLLVEVHGSACLADVIQGLSRARLANPARFRFYPAPDIQQTIWTRPGQGTLTVTWRGEEDVKSSADETLLSIDIKNA